MVSGLLSTRLFSEIIYKLFTKTHLDIRIEIFVFNCRSIYLILLILYLFPITCWVSSEMTDRLCIQRVLDNSYLVEWTGLNKMKTYFYNEIIFLFTTTYHIKCMWSVTWSWKKLPSLLLIHCIYGANRWDKQCTECELCTHCIHPNKDSKHVTSPQPVQWAAGSGGLVQNGENQGWNRSNRHRGRWTVWTLGVIVCWIMMQNVDSLN